MDERPTGWYDDPDDPARLRYWDGSVWTDRTHPKAPIPAPQPPKPPVSRLRPPRPTDDGRAGVDRSAPGAPGPWHPDTDSPRPWSTPGTDVVGSRAEARGARGPGVRASYGRRVAAYLIDLALVGIVFFTVALAVLPMAGDVLQVQQTWVQGVVEAFRKGATPPEPPRIVIVAGMITSALHTAMLVLYDAILIRRSGVTPGCRMAGIRVTSQDGAPVPGDRSFRRALVKHAGFVLGSIPMLSPFGMLFATVNLLWPTVDRRRFALHDIWSGTQVLRT